MKNLTKPVGDLYPHVKKLTLIMRLSVLLILIAVFTSTASVYSQATKLTIKMENARLSEVFDAIEKQSEFYFFYNRDYFNDDRIVSVDVKNKLVDEVLKELLQGEAITWEIFDRNILLRIPEAPLTTAQREVMEQQKSVSGKVTDSDNQPLPGVTVVVKGTTQGTVTNADGIYSLMNIPEDATLVFSFVGMRTQEVLVGSQTNLNIRMEEETIGIEEVVAVGYGTQKKINLTGSIAVVDYTQLENRSLVNLDQALQGVAANLNVTTGYLGGEIGAKKEINIRGVGTLTGDGGSPYVLVDGMPMGINTVDPDNIESISVLKDASSAAIYGAKAAYGVILITTKSGKGKKVNFQYNSSVSLQHPTVIADFVSSVDMANLHNYAASNSGKPGIPEEQMNRIIDYYNGEIDTETIPNPAQPDRWATHLAQGSNSNNNWPRIMWGNWRPRTKHNLSFSGEKENVRFYVAANYSYEKGVIKFSPEEQNKYSLLANLSVDVNKWMTINLNTTYSRTELSRKIASKDGDRQDQWGFIMVVAPTHAYYAPDGQIISTFVISDQQLGREILNPNEFWVKTSTELEPIDGWKTNVNYTWNNYTNRSTINKKTTSNPTISGVPYAGGYLNPSFTETNSNHFSHVFSLHTSYEKSFGEHNLFAMIGYEEQYYEGMSTGITKMGVISPEVPSLSTAVGEMFLDNSWSHWSTQGVFGRVTYNYKEKYLLEFNSRYDGSSRFANASTQWGYFPSGSLAYNISKEPFWDSIENVSSINLLKLRLSYGSLGNQNVSNYLYLPIIPMSTDLTYIIGDSRPNYSNMPSLISPDLTWETANTLNAGVDVGLLNNRLNLGFDIFNRKTVNMFGPSQQLPAALGTSAERKNNAELETKGFDLEISFKDNITNDLSYSVKLNIGDTKSTVTKYFNPTGSLGSMSASNYANHLTAWYEGKVVGEIWGYETIGYFQDAADVENHADQSKIYSRRWQEGDIKYKDLNNDGKIDWGSLTKDDHGDLKIIGNDMPRYQFGITSLVNYKNFDFRMFWQGVAKRDMVFAYTGLRGSFYGWKGRANNNTFCEPHMDYWTPEGSDHGGGPNAYFPRPYFDSEDGKNKQYQTKYVQNAAYIRLKDIQLGYTIPQSFTKKIGIDRFWLYISGSNLLYFSPLIKIYDPELLSEGALFGGVGTYIHPMLKYYTFGINVTF